jgi:hypothetical protein
MMPDWILLLPILFPLAGAVFFTLIAPRVPERVRAALPLTFLTIEIITILVNIAPGLHAFALSDWSASAFSIAFQMDGVTLLLLLALFVPLAAIWLVAPPRTPFALFPTLVVTGAVLLAASATPITVYTAWVILDVAIFAWRLAYDIEKEGTLRMLAVSQSAALALFTGSLILGSDRSADAALLIALAFWARLALFPFQWSLPTRGADAHDLWLARGVSLIAASNLWLHWSTLHVDAPITLIGTLFSICIIAAVIWIWREEHPTRAVIVATSHAIAFVPLAILFGGDAGPALSLWLALSAVIALAWFEIAQRWRAENRNRYPLLIWFAGILSLAGLPLTPAFLGRVGLYVSLWEAGQWLVLLIAGVTTLLLLVPLWNLGFDIQGTENRKATRLENAGLVLMTLAGAALALAPMLIAHVLGPDMGNSAERAIDRSIRTNDALGVAIGFAMVILPVIGSYFLRIPARHFHPRTGSLLLRTAHAIDLDWLALAFTSIGYRVGAVARGASTIAEENPTVWILFAGLWVAIFISLVH